VPQNVARWRSWCDERNLFLIEDAAMAWLSSYDGRPIGSFGHLAIFCLYKTFGLPDGGALVAEPPPPAPDSTPDPCLKQVAIRHASWLAQRYGVAGRVHGALRGHASPSRLAPEAGQEFDLGDPTVSPCSSTIRLLPKIVDARAAARRRENYDLLRRELGDRVDPVFSRIGPGASPVGFPFRADSARQPQLLHILERNGIVGARFWPEPHPSLGDSGYERSASLRANCIVLPVHQEVRVAELERAVHAVSMWARGGAGTVSA
jgi:perosamine synthetase